MMLHLVHQKKFDSETWKKFPSRRKYYIKDILKRDLPLGKTYEEIAELLGRNESQSMKENRWAYALYTDSLLRRKYFLMVYFADGRVVKARQEYKVLY